MKVERAWDGETTFQELLLWPQLYLLGIADTKKGQETEGKTSHTPGLHNSVTQSHCPRLLPSECWGRGGTSLEKSVVCFTLLSHRLEPLTSHIPPNMQCFWLSYAWFIPLAWITIPTVNFLYNYRSKWCSRGPWEASSPRCLQEAQLCTLSALNCVQAQNGCDQTLSPLQQFCIVEFLFSFALDEIKITLNSCGLWSLFLSNWVLGSCFVTCQL